MMNGVLIFDLDDVLVDFSMLMYRNIRENWRIYNRWFVDRGELTYNEVQERKFFNIQEWLIKSKFMNLESGEYTNLQKLIEATLKRTFFNMDPYQYAVPNEFAKKTLLNQNYIESKSISKVYILSRNVTKGQAESKKRFIKRYFTHPKIQYIELGLDSKGEYLKKNNIDFNLIVDDEIPNIRGIIENISDIHGKEFLIPEYGYNSHLPPELKIIIDEKEAVVTYYKI